jgi:SRSO17 transposase
MFQLSLDVPSVQAQVDEVNNWANEFDALVERIGPHFARSEARVRARDYLVGLLSPVERKNGWQLAEQVGNQTPYGIQNLLGRAQWDANAVRDELIAYVVEHLGHEQAVLVVDETGFVKKGKHSVGVQRQYSGTAGRVENCQIGVFLSYASPQGYTFLDRELYLPKSWTDDPQRCRSVGVPDEVKFATKPQLARQMLERAFKAGVPAAWVTADEVYGGDRRLRLWLEQQQQAYVMAVSTLEVIEIDEEMHKVDSLVTTVEETAWQRISCGDGTKGPREYDWVRIHFNCPDAPGWERWLLVRRSKSDPKDLSYYLVFAKSGTCLEEMVSVAGTRWTIETSFETAKGEVGLDQYEVRSWTGWYRHITLTLLAHAFLTVTRAMGAREFFKKEATLAKPNNSLREFKHQRGLCCP